MSIIIALIVFAFLLFFLEIFLPGGILAVAGGIVLIAASVVTLQTYGLIPALLVFGISGLGAFLLLFWEVKFLTKSGIAKSVQSNSAVEGASLQKVNIEGIENEIGEVISPLNPTGRIRIAGRILDAKADQGFIEVGSKVTISGVDVFHVRVRTVTTDQN